MDNTLSNVSAEIISITSGYEAYSPLPSEPKDSGTSEDCIEMFNSAAIPLGG